MMQQLCIFTYLTVTTVTWWAETFGPWSCTLSLCMSKTSAGPKTYIFQTNLYKHLACNINYLVQTCTCDVSLNMEVTILEICTLLVVHSKGLASQLCNWLFSFSKHETTHWRLGQSVDQSITNRSVKCSAQSIDILLPFSVRIQHTERYKQIIDRMQ